MATPLTVLLGGRSVGVLTEERSRLRFAYAEPVLDEHGLGRPLLSISLPTSVRRFTDRQSRPFFDGLLPEGEARRIVAYDLGLAERDTFGLLRAIGRECAGAVAILEPDAPPEARATAARARRLTQDELDARIADLRSHPLGIDGDVRVSLAGWQEKLLVTDLGDGHFGLPVEGSASTHVIKPANALFPELVVGEAWCLRAAAIAGVHAAEVSLAPFGGRRAIVVTRFDRRIHGDGTIERRHQEDICQATATPLGRMDRRYEEHGGPSFGATARILTRWAHRADLVELLRQVTVNVLVGNADAHAMNTSLLLPPDGAVHLAPLYDVAPTASFPGISTVAGMFVNGVRDINQITLDDVRAEGLAWGLDAVAVAGAVRGVAEALPPALLQSAEELDVPSDLVTDVQSRLRRLAP